MDYINTAAHAYRLRLDQDGHRNCWRPKKKSIDGSCIDLAASTWRIIRLQLSLGFLALRLETVSPAVSVCSGVAWRPRPTWRFLWLVGPTQWKVVPSLDRFLSSPASTCSTLAGFHWFLRLTPTSAPVVCHWPNIVLAFFLDTANAYL